LFISSTAKAPAAQAVQPVTLSDVTEPAAQLEQNLAPSPERSPEAQAWQVAALVAAT
jgi:hypothetical protein